MTALWMLYTLSDQIGSYQGVKIWNAISDNIKLLSLKQFKKKLKSSIIASY